MAVMTRSVSLIRPRGVGNERQERPLQGQLLELQGARTPPLIPLPAPQASGAMLAVLHVITLGTHDPHPVYPDTVGKTTRTVPKQGQNGVDFTNWHTKLRKDLLKGYDVNSPPISNRFLNTGFSMAANVSDAGTDVKLQLRVLKLDSIDVAGGPC